MALRHNGIAARSPAVRFLSAKWWFSAVSSGRGVKSKPFIINILTSGPLIAKLSLEAKP
jgi:hypothetical protein